MKSDSVDNNTFHWYTLRVLRNEEKCIDQIKEHISLNKLQDKISEILLLKEYVIVESDDFSSGSDFLPKRGFRSTENSVWVKVSNGDYRRIKIVEKKPFSGMIFLKMICDPNLFEMIKEWDASFSFLGYPFPSVISDDQMKKTIQSLNHERPNLKQYIKEKGYLIVEGSIGLFKNAKVKQKEIIEQKPVEAPQEKIVRPKEVTMEEKKEEIYSDLNINLTEVPSFGTSSKINKFKSNKNQKKDDELKVNDYVLVTHLGFKGVIQLVDYEKDLVVVGVHMFGRRQPVECKISEVSLL